MMWPFHHRYRLTPSGVRCEMRQWKMRRRLRQVMLTYKKEAS